MSCRSRWFGLADFASESYAEPEIEKIFQTAAFIESNYYMKATRLEELMIFSKKMQYKHLGVAFYIGLAKEAKILCGILSKEFSVNSVCCKVCGVSKEELNLPKIHQESKASICNPILQAQVLNESGCQLNIVLGLGLGHNLLFAKFSQSPVTTLVVKDRVLAHNPVAALYSNYYLRNKFNYSQE